MQLIHRGIALDREDRRTIWRIVLPSLVELVFTQLFAMVDTIMLGQTEISAVAIAAVGLTNNPVNLVNGVLTALHIGTTAAVAWAVGAGNENAARSITRTALTLSLILGTFASAVLYFPAGQLVTFMGAQEDTYVYAKEYLEIVALGMLPAMVGFACTASLRGIGLTRLPMAYNLAGNLFNVIGNYALIYGRLGMPELGVAGAAISTTISRYVACTLALLVLFRGHSKLRLHIREDFRLRKEWLKRIFGVGVTSGLEQLIMQIGFIMFARTVSGLGTVIFAAHQIGLSVNGLTWMPGQAFGVAATTLVGQNMGAGNPEKAKSFVRVIWRYSVLVALLIAALFLLFSQYIVLAYTNDPEVARLASTVLKIIAFGMPGIATQLPIASALRGAGDSRFPLYASAIGIWVFRVLVAPLFVYTFGWGLNGAWYTIALDQTTRAVVVYLRFRTDKWMHIKSKLAG